MHGEREKVMSERGLFLRRDVLERDLRLPPDRAVVVDAALQASTGLPQIERMARAMERVFAEAPVRIGVRELIVGFRGFDGYPELEQAMARGGAECPYHIADFEAVLRDGVDGVIARAENRLADLDEANPAEMEAVQFLRAVIRSCRAVVRWAHRYAAEAERQAAAEPDPVRGRELLQIAERCRRVPGRPAVSFAEAVQSVWFVYVALYLETVAASCLGRLDQYLYPFYVRDLQAGRLTRGEAGELLCCLWAKLYENVCGHVGTHGQTATLGGLLPDGSSGVNELTYLILEVAAQMGNVGAQIAIRWHERQDPGVLSRAVDLAADGAIMPQVYNDETYVGAHQRRGIPTEDARQYAIFGCHEPVIAGMGYQRPASLPGYVSFYDWLEEALGLRSAGVKLIGMGAPDHLPVIEVIGPPPASAEELWNRWIKAMKRGIRLAVIAANQGDRIKRELMPRPLLSAFYRDCVSRGRDITAGGARYNMTGFQGCALATAVDSFNAIKELVFEQQRVSMADLIAALQANFAGHEPLRRLLLTEPSKFGQDDDRADATARRLCDAYCDEIERYTNSRGGGFSPGLWSFLNNLAIGWRTGASPDGRLAGAPVSHSMDPVSGQALAGPTAVIRSLAKLDQRRLSNGGSTLLEFAGSWMRTSGARQAAAALCETYLRLGGIEIQISCASVERLLAAQQDPESYQDLVVRVAGYSDFFVRHSPELQRYIIEREKHAVEFGRGEEAGALRLACG